MISSLHGVLVTLTLLSFVICKPAVSYEFEEFDAESFLSLNPDQIDALIRLHGDNAPEYHSIELDPEAYMTVEEIIQYHGYQVTTYTVQTQDGYILTIQRIPHGKNGPGSQPRKPVLVQHGIFCSSASWVSNIPEKNLPYLLADAGYDVWLGNVRGTLFGRNHTKLSPKKKAFWEFSYDEMAKYDLPAVIDFMLTTTGFKQIDYVGHSMGTTMIFALLSTQAKYNDIVCKTVYALAPMARAQGMRSPIRLMVPYRDYINWWLSFFSNGETRLPVFLHHTPAGTSLQALLHLAQSAASDTFQKHDFGEKQNKKVYGQSTPPIYNLSDITSKVVLFWGENDLLSSSSDISWLGDNLQNLVLKYRVADKNFSHVDFLWAIDVKTLLYDKLIEMMTKV
uniref:Lipase n=1 Tax=Strigamia maritima TaxID=126957 RepID=T1JB83_STRMM